MPKSNIGKKKVGRPKKIVKNNIVEKSNDNLGIKSMPMSLLGFLNNNNKSVKDGISKPTNVSFDQLRLIARYDAVIRICINAIKKEVSQSNWAIVPKPMKKVSQKLIDEITDRFLFVNTQGENFRMLLDRMLEDLLTIDAGVIEVVRNAKGIITDLNSIDGATLKPCLNSRGEHDPDRAYVQVIDNKVVAEFKEEDIIYIMANPQSDIRYYGFGFSNIESILLAVQASLNADMYNSRAFSDDNIPPGILDLGDVTQEEAERFQMLWDATVIGNTRKLKMVWGSGKGKKYQPFQSNNKDMQFVEYIDWLSRLKLAVYGLTPLDANITQDINKSVAAAQRSISQSRGVRNIKKLLEEYFYRNLLIPMGGKDLEFKFEVNATMEEKKIQAEIDKIYLDSGVITPQEVAKREGFDYLAIDNVDYVEPKVEPKEPTQRKGKYFKPLY